MVRTMKIAVSLGSLLLYATSCGILDLGEDAPAPYVIEVEAVTFNTPVSSQDTLRIRFHGWAGTNSCEGFYRMSVTPFQDGAIFKLWGHALTSGEGTCDDGQIQLVEYYDVPLPDPGYFHVVVIQPDGSELDAWAEIGD